MQFSQSHFEHLGRDSRLSTECEKRAEVADAVVNVELAVRRDAHQAVEAEETGRVDTPARRRHRSLASHCACHSASCVSSHLKRCAPLVECILQVAA